MQCRRNDIRVAVVHGPGNRIAPKWFDLDRTRHTITGVTNCWQVRQGEALVQHFHVTDEGALYELVYNRTDGIWSLERIEPL